MSIHITAGSVVVLHQLQDDYVRKRALKEECDISLIEIFNSYIFERLCKCRLK